MRIVVAALAVLLSILPDARAGEKNGVAPTVVSLPSGPGTVEGLGASFEPMLQTGTAGHVFPFALPPGTARHGPSLALVYDGGFGNGPVGYGWKLELPSVKRQVERGIPRYLEPTEDDTYLSAAGVELVELANGYWLSRIEKGFWRYRRVDSGTPGLFHWEAHSPNGTLHEFGVTPSARVSLAANESPDGREHVFEWKLERSVDVHGNTIEYEWSASSGPTDRRTYLRAIRWGPGPSPWEVHNIAVLDWEARSDVITDCRAGFPIKTSQRLSRVSVGVHGAPAERTAGCRVEDIDGDGEDDALIRRYELLYEGNRHWSLLTQITLVGCDGVSSLPPAAFRYGSTDDALDQERTFSAEIEHLIFAENAPPIAADSDDVELADLNGDGLPDLLHTIGTHHRAFLNLGMKLYEPSSTTSCDDGVCRIAWSEAIDVDPVGTAGATTPHELRIGAEHVHLADMDADGLADLVVTEGDLVRWYPNRGAAGAGPGRGELWGAAREMAIAGEAPPPPFDASAGGSVRTLDVDFDKKIDVVRGSPAGYTIWRNLGGGGYAEPVLTCGAIVDGEVLDLGDPGVKLADLNGDRLLDVARIDPWRIVVATHLGRGEFLPAIEIDVPDAVLDERQREHAVLADVNADGLADLVIERAERDELWFWLNLGDGTLSRRRVVRDLQQVASDVRVDWADMNANGTTDLVYSDSRLCDGLRVRVIDIGMIVDGSSHPRLLKTIDNGLGARTEITYRSSSDQYQDARAAGNPWSISSPMPIQVVSRIEMSTGDDLDGVPGVDVATIDLVYRDGFYDSVRRRFNGFGFVKRIARGDAWTPTLVERHRFHTGGPDGLDNDGDGETDEVEDRIGREEEPLEGATLWKELTGLPDDPLADGGFADDSVVFTREIAPLESWEIRDIGDGALAALLGDDGYRVALADRAIVLVVTREKRMHVIEQGRDAARELRATSDSNALGAPTFEHELGEVVNDAPVGSTRFREHEYAHNVAKWILGRPARTRTRDGGPDGDFVAEGRNYYDGKPFVGLPLGEVGDRALPTRSETFISAPDDWTPASPALPPLAEESARIGDPRAPGASVDSARARFDAFGNAVELLGPRGYSRTIAFDPWLHVHAIGESIETGGPGGPLILSTQVHLAHAVVTESTDFNGHVTRYEYDVFGRPTAVARPGDDSARPTVIYRYAHANPRPLVGLRPRPGDAALAASTPHVWEYDRAGSLTLRSGAGVPRESSVRTSTREVSGGDSTFDAIEYVDGAARGLASLSESTTSGKWIVSGAAWRSLRGTPCRSFQAYEQDGEAYAPPIEGVSPYSDAYHDALGRALRVVEPPDEDGVRHESRTVHRPLAVDVWDGEDTLPGGRHEGTYTTTISDGLRRIERVIERNARATDPVGGTAAPDSTSEYITRYVWNLQDALVAVEDAQGNRKHMRLDGLGRRVVLADVDAGLGTYRHDDAGNLVEFVDAKGHRTVYTHDGADRVLTIDFFDANGDSTDAPIRYRYDAIEGAVPFGDGTTRAARNVRGRLARVRDGSGESHSSWDDRGNVEWSARMVPDPVTGIPIWYGSTLEYDDLDRLRERIYPDGDRVTYTYDRRSRVDTVRGGETGREIVRGVDYLPNGALGSIEYGNGVTSLLRHDERLRLVESTTMGAGATANVEIGHRRYTFDGVSNVVAARDLRASVPASDPRHDSKRFEYDDLYRLTLYELTNASLDANRAAIGYRYDRIGNMLAKTSSTTSVNLGAYGYAGGRFDRHGRTPGDPPGPHAVTGTASGRTYDYDENGNARTIDGRTATWDVQDRLVRLEKSNEIVRFTYDHGGARVSKRVERNGRVEHVLWIDPGFEVREGEEPTKYVFAGSRRVARVKGTLDPTRERIQRMRIVEGWNVLSLVVTIPLATARTVFGLGDPDQAVTTVATFDGQTLTPLDPDENLAAGEAYWVLATEPRFRILTGSYAPPTAPIDLSKGRNVIAWPRLDGLRPEACLENVEQSWWFDAPASAWRIRDFPRTAATDLIDPAAPGTGVWAFAGGAPARFDPEGAAAQDVLFYHVDHLGSTSVVTDLDGKVVAETAYYPFGEPRHEHRPTSWFDAAYGFTGMERDRESGLSYHGARYYDPIVGRFMSADPLHVENGDGGGNPQRMSVYSYVLNNPLRFVDPTGLEEESVPYYVTARPKRGDYKTGKAYVKAWRSWNRYNRDRKRPSFGQLRALESKSGPLEVKSDPAPAPAPAGVPLPIVLRQYGIGDSSPVVVIVKTEKGPQAVIVDKLKGELQDKVFEDIAEKQLGKKLAGQVVPYYKLYNAATGTIEGIEGLSQASEPGEAVGTALSTAGATTELVGGGLALSGSTAAPAVLAVGSKLGWVGVAFTVGYGTTKYIVWDHANRHKFQDQYEYRDGSWFPKDPNEFGPGSHPVIFLSPTLPTEK